MNSPDSFSLDLHAFSEVARALDIISQDTHVSVSLLQVLTEWMCIMQVFMIENGSCYNYQE